MVRELLSRIPRWGQILVLAAATAGMAAVGSGIAGDAAVKVREPITFDSDSGVSGDTDENDSVIYNDDTSITLTASTHPGDSYEINLVLNNQSESSQSARLIVDAPDGFRFSDATSGIGETGDGHNYSEVTDLLFSSSGFNSLGVAPLFLNRCAGTSCNLVFEFTPSDPSALVDEQGVALQPGDILNPLDISDNVTVTHLFANGNPVLPPDQGVVLITREDWINLDRGNALVTESTGTLGIRVDLSGASLIASNHLVEVTYGHNHTGAAAVDGRVTVVQEGPTTFTFTLDAEADGDANLDSMTIEVETLPQVAPGWYSIAFHAEALPTDLANVGP